MNIPPKKLSLPFYALIILWCLIAFVSLWVFAGFVVASFSPWTAHKLSDARSMYMIIFSSEALLIAFWRISTFRRRDLVRILKREGVQVKKRSPIFLFFAECLFWTFPQGSFRDSYVIARINGSYNLPLTLGGSTDLTPDRVFSTDRIDFISLITGPFSIDEEIRIDKKNRKIPDTGVPDIDSVLQEILRNADDFRARLIFNNEYFRLIVISSPWLGGKYEKRVVKGFEIFRKIDEILKKKYPHRKWEGLEMKWNGHKYEFDPIRIAG